MGDELDTGWVEAPHVPPEEFAEKMNHVNRPAGEYPPILQQIFLFKARVSSM